MEDHTATDLSLQRLRERAEAALERVQAGRAAPPPQDLKRLVHELQVHQVELEMQNEQLRRAEAHLAASRDRYQALYEFAPVAHLTLDRSSTIREANLCAAELLGVEQADLQGRPLTSFMTEHHADALHLCLQDVFESGLKQDCELSLQVWEGESIRRAPVQLTAIASSAGGQTQADQGACRCVVVDLTKQMKAERELRESEARFRQISEHVGDVFLLHDRESRSVVYANPAFETVWGRPVSELYGSGADWLQSTHPEDRERIEEAYANMLRGDPFDEEYRICRSNEEVRWVRGRNFPIEEQDGRVDSDVIVIQDITNEHELQQELHQAQKMEAVGALASGVAHDFNNVLQAILGCMKVALDEPTLPDRARQHLTRVAATAKRGGQLAGQLTAFTRKQPADPKPIAIDAVVERSSRLIERLVTEQVKVEIRPNARGMGILADEVQVEQILMNLAANSRDAMPEGGTLSIRTDMLMADELVSGQRGGAATAERYVRLVVEDSGTGMNDRTRARIFDPFFTTKEVGKGTGLGLSTVFAVTRQLGGRVEVDSELGRGTKFAFYFPCCEAPLSEVSAGAHDEPRLRGTVLLVEDDALVRQTLAHCLQHLGLDFVEAQDASEAQHLMQVHGTSVDLLISDIALPGLRGPKLAALLKERHPELPVLFISAHPAFLGNETTVLGAPVLEKPFGIEELAGALEELLRAGVAGRRVVPAPPAHEDERPQRPAVDAGSRTLLLVEDDPALRLDLGELLGDEGYHVLVAARPSEALAAAAEHTGSIDILLSDVRLPEMSGEEMAEQLRSSQPGMHVVFMSGASDRPPGATEFLQKPFDLDDVIDVVQRTLWAR